MQPDWYSETWLGPLDFLKALPLLSRRLFVGQKGTDLCTLTRPRLSWWWRDSHRGSAIDPQNRPMEGTKGLLTSKDRHTPHSRTSAEPSERRPAEPTAFCVFKDPDERLRRERACSRAGSGKVQDELRALGRTKEEVGTDHSLGQSMWPTE
jgi:hypothetical protein